MNLTIVSNVSRLLVRNLSVLKLQQDIGVRNFYKIKLPAILPTQQQQQPQRMGPTPSDGVYYYESGGGGGNGGGEQNSSRGRLAGGNGVVGLSAVGLAFNFFGKSSSDAEETPEDKLIATIKRSILCIQREQYDKAEQMLHLALRMAQDLQSKEGITYVFDVMANLAMEREQFKKAERLFADVMKRLFADGHAEDSSQILHISAKMAHMAQLQGELEKAMQGFTWTLKKIEENLSKVPDDKDIQELWGLTKNWFGQLLMKQGKYSDAKKAFQEAYDCLIQIYGSVNEEAITILNNLSVACVNLEDFADAKKYLLQALDLVKELKDATQEGILQANLGLIYLREGLVSQAKETCTLAWRIGKKCKNVDAIEQAEYCLDEIKTFVQ